MKDFRPVIKAKGWTQRKVWRQVGGVEAHFHRVVAGETRTSINYAKKIAAVIGVSWTEFFEDEAHDSTPQEPAA